MQIERSVAVRRSPRLKILEGLFDLPPASQSRRQWSLPIEALDAPILGDWRVGLITGPSGAGKSVIAGELLAAAEGRLFDARDQDGIDRPPFGWPADASVVDGFPRALDVPAITGLLCSVGFSSPPDWLKPFGRLSNGQQFRVSLARALAEQIVIGRDKEAEPARGRLGASRERGGQHAPQGLEETSSSISRDGVCFVNPSSGQPASIIAYDEFGSLVNAQVRQIAAAACARAVRREGLRFVAVTCHDDVAPWLEADWVMLVDGDDVRLKVYTDAPPAGAQQENIEILPRRCLRRPHLELRVERCDPSAWQRFKRHHYLSADLAKTALCWVGIVKEVDAPEEEARPAAFTAVLPFPHPKRPGWREHRTVCLPDYQGVGIGNAMSELVASIYARGGKPYFSTTSHPSMIAHRRRSPLWRMVRRPMLKARHAGKIGGSATMADATATDRLTAGFEFVGSRPPAVPA